MADRRGDREWLATLLEVQEGRFGLPLLDDEGIRDLLRSGPRIAIVGASANPGRPSHGVMQSLRRAGYSVVPVNPRETEIEGLRCYASVDEAVRETGPVDIVDVFRRPDQCVEHAHEAVRVGAQCLWLQLGIVNAEAARVAHDGGLAVVMDRCTIIEHRRLVAGAS